MRLNTKPAYPFGGLTFEGAPAARMSTEQALRRSVMSCLLWEDEFYEDGQTIAARIVDLVGQADPDAVVAMIDEARNLQHLRHVPLLMVAALAKRGGCGPQVERAIVGAVRRADELAELLAIHAKVNDVAPSAVKKKIPAAMKRGLAAAFQRFDEYALAKYDRAGAVRLRDVLFLCHAKPRDDAQAALWKRLVDGQLVTPDTWEVGLSTGGDKKATFERLLRDGKLGYLALLRNLRNMVDAGCDLDLVRSAIVARRGAERVLPFRFVAAARACPQLEPEIDAALCEVVATAPRLVGRTVVLVDLSGSMENQLSAKSDMKRLDAAAALASVIHAESLRVFSFSSQNAPNVPGAGWGRPQQIKVVEHPPRRGMAGVDAIITGHGARGGTFLFSSVQRINETVDYDRIIVITDEQASGSHILGSDGDPVRALPAPKGRGYMINVASAQRGVGYGPWQHIDGWSENVIRFIVEAENVAGRT
ncbi:MAG: TROVE domain-containing protein [Rhodoblastus sp.]|nr:TROVE domain-containing protein [Rhodoblastus sp.]